MLSENSMLKYNNQSLDDTVRANEEKAKQLQLEVSHLEGVLREAFSIFATHTCSDSDRSLRAGGGWEAESYRSPLNIEDLGQENSFLVSESDQGRPKFLAGYLERGEKSEAGTEGITIAASRSKHSFSLQFRPPQPSPLLGRIESLTSSRTPGEESGQIATSSSSYLLDERVDEDSSHGDGGTFAFIQPAHEARDIRSPVMPMGVMGVPKAMAVATRMTTRLTVLPTA
eukprot:747306-Hanusia_phi.AAC.4